MTMSTALLSTNRSNLQLCVESLVSGLSNQQVQGKVRGAMTKVANHPDFQHAGLGRGPIVVDQSCPSDPLVLDPTHDKVHRERLGNPKKVTEPSTYRTFVYVITDAQLAQGFRLPDRYPRLSAQEVMEEGGLLPTVTMALYVTANELNDPSFLEHSLTHAVGLWPVDEPRTEESPPIDPRGK